MSVTVQASSLARRYLASYLRRTLPAKVASINAARFASMVAAYAGPYNIPANSTLKVGSVPGSETSCALTAGAARTAAQVAADVTSAAPPGQTASADAQGRFLVTANVAPVVGTSSVTSIGNDGSGGTNSLNAVFGWDSGGEQSVVSAIVAPLFKGVADGWPQDLGEMGPGFWVILEDSKGTPRPNPRTNTMLVDIDLGIAWADPSNQVSRNKEPIGQCLRAVREVILEDRTLDTGPGQNGVVVFLTEVLGEDIKGRPLQWEGSPAFDAAMLKLRVKLYESHVP